MWANPYGRVLFTSDPGVVWWWYSEAFSSTEVANICTNRYTNVGYEWNELDCYWTWNEIRNTSRLLVVIVIKTGIAENLVLPRRCLRSPGTQGNTRILVYRDTSKLLIMNMQFILAALVYSSSAESNRVLSDIPFGPAKSHIGDQGSCELHPGWGPHLGTPHEPPPRKPFDLMSGRGSPQLARTFLYF